MCPSRGRRMLSEKLKTGAGIRNMESRRPTLTCNRRALVIVHLPLPSQSSVQLSRMLGTLVRLSSPFLAVPILSIIVISLNDVLQSHARRLVELETVGEHLSHYP